MRNLGGIKLSNCLHQLTNVKFTTARVGESLRHHTVSWPPAEAGNLACVQLLLMTDHHRPQLDMTNEQSASV